MFRFLRDKEKWAKIREESEYEPLRAILEENYKKYCENKEIPSLLFSKWILYPVTGDRHEFETPYFERRYQLSIYAILCMIYPEREEYLEKLQDVIWAICQEHSWAAPAHIPADRLNEEVTIDLFASETGLYLAEIKYMLADRLSPIIIRKITSEIKRRIIDSMKNNHFFFETVKSNWSAVCGGSVGITLFYEDPDAYVELKERIEASIERYLESIGDDGSVSEGVSYWEYGFGFYMLYSEMYEKFTMGRYNLLSGEKIEKLARFYSDMCMSDSVMYSFADGSEKLKNNLYHSYYLNKKLGVPLPAFDKAFINFSKFSWAVRAFLYFDPSGNSGDRAENRAYYEKLQCFVERKKNYSFAVKGGHNGEEHNHNDVGSFVIVADDRQILCDLGAPMYSHFTLSPQNYDKVIEKSSKGHSVPLVNGTTQGWGEQFFGKLTVSGDSVSVDMKGAYPEKIDTLLREFKLFDNKIILTDFYKGCTPAERFVTEIKPEISEGTIKIGCLTMTFDKSFKTSVSNAETRGHLGEERSVYLIDVLSDKTEGEMSFEIIPCAETVK